MGDAQEVVQKLKRLSRRELEVFQERCQGKSIADIAAILVIVESTVKYHLGNIYAKLELDYLPQAARNLEIPKFCDALRHVPEEDILQPEPEPELEAPQPMSLVPVLEDELALVRQEQGTIQLWRPSMSPPIGNRPFPYDRQRGVRNFFILIVTTMVISGLAGAGIMALIFTVTTPLLILPSPPSPTNTIAPPTPISSPFTTFTPTHTLRPLVPSPTVTPTPPPTVPTATLTPKPPVSTPPVEPSPSLTILYEEDFEDGKADGWLNVLDGEWSIYQDRGNMVYGVRDQPADFIQIVFLEDSAPWQDYSLETEVMFESGELEQIYLVARTGKGSDCTGYSFGGNRYHISIFRLDPRSTCQGETLAELADYPLVANRLYKMGLEVQGPQIRAYIDDVLVMGVEDAIYPRGGIALSAYQVKWAYFDNIRVVALGE